ncbi:FKBP-type peptidyl-prolyl cis-trans isomerase [Gynurincola endophyticus]|uniref:FKBP-type peptidyl-prolyl cis-trans isomerase n=1 Tax=Gynurincola endophyticus TaxID=2479004 RepID=UPI000F8DFC1E|nr:FKBP-type peptidyl-prolyl cis-trans isomerase [Gynurincola endophyticus]
MKKLSAILSTVALAAMVSCSGDGNLKTTASGLRYKIFDGGTAEKAQYGDIIKFRYEQRIKFAKTGKDSILNSNAESMPAYAKVDSVGAVYDPSEVFNLLGLNDSAVTYISVDSLAKKGANLPPFITKEDELLVTFKVVQIFKDDSTARADQMIEVEKEQARLVQENQKLEDKAASLIGPKTEEIEKYLADNKINTVKAPKGTFVLVSNAGTGAQVEDGKTLVIKYTGKLFPSGEQFESNAGPDGRPFEFVIGQGRVIQGWEEGLKFFKKGGKGTLFIPFNLAYGAQPGPGGTPHENLIFDIEIVDVK